MLRLFIVHTTLEEATQWQVFPKEKLHMASVARSEWHIRF